MSRSRLAVSMVCISFLLIGTVHMAAGWFPLTNTPLIAQEQVSGDEPKAPQTTPIQVGGDIQDLKLIFRTDPVYPEEARPLGLNGIVRLRVTINEEGQVYRIVTQAGHPMLIHAAFDAVEKWRYSPTFLNGKPVSVVTDVTCFFLNNETAAIGERPGVAKPSASAPPISAPGIVADMARRPTVAVSPPAGRQSAGDQIKPPRTEPIRIGSMVQESKLIHRVEPVYPEQALREGIQGTVRLTIVINEEGFVYELRAMEGNNPILEAAAMDAVKQWQYSPTLLNGEPVAAQAVVTVIFNLK